MYREGIQQSISSVRSGQSDMPLHRKALSMHRPVPHLNCDSRHKWVSLGDRERKGIEKVVG